MDSMQPKPHSRGLALAVLLALALLPRLCVLLAPQADLYRQRHAAPQSRPFISVGEEATRGSVALEIVRGPLLPVLDYQYATFFGGSTVVAVLAAPLFAVFGPRLWALKAVPIGFHLAAVVLLFLILSRFAARRVARGGSGEFSWRSLRRATPSSRPSPGEATWRATRWLCWPATSSSIFAR